MKKNYKDILLKLENLYYSNINTIRDRNIGSYPDVPSIQDDTEYKTHIIIPPATTDAMKEDLIKQPEVKTKTGKNVVSEPPVEQKNDKIDNDIEIYDMKGKEIKNWDKSEAKEGLDNWNTELEEMVISISKSLVEQKKEEDENGMGDLAQDNMGEQNPESGENPNIDPNVQQPDPNTMMGGQQMVPNNQMGMDPNAMMGAQPQVDPMTGEPTKTAEEVGKIFELKKIYSRLLAIESQLSFSSDIVLLKLRKYISQAIELFETVISNINTFQDNIDDIIVMYYEFLTQVYEIMKKFYKKEYDEEKQNKK